mmetsp:Transcript_7865/g.13990  ORF Transcript_7865/g.13990 Transcript_7865/m.13990 type:complete len:80 (+) Transcript_7865:99-338(+)
MLPIHSRCQLETPTPQNNSTPGVFLHRAPTPTIGDELTPRSRLLAVSHQEWGINAPNIPASEQANNWRQCECTGLVTPS